MKAADTKREIQIIQMEERCSTLSELIRRFSKFKDIDKVWKACVVELKMAEQRTEQLKTLRTV